jgi:hypothetical protein
VLPDLMARDLPQGMNDLLHDYKSPPATPASEPNNALGLKLSPPC